MNLVGIERRVQFIARISNPRISRNVSQRISKAAPLCTQSVVNEYAACFETGRGVRVRAREQCQYDDLEPCSPAVLAIPRKSFKGIIGSSTEPNIVRNLPG